MPNRNLLARGGELSCSASLPRRKSFHPPREVGYRTDASATVKVTPNKQPVQWRHLMVPKEPNFVEKYQGSKATLEATMASMKM